MQIEEHIQQNKFENQWHKLRVNLLASSGWLNEQIRDFVAPFGITQKQFNILRILRGKSPEEITVLEIRSRMIDKMSDASRLVDRLEKKNLISKRPCSHDKRATRVKITKEGLRLLKMMDDEMKRLDAILYNLTEEEATVLNDLLDKMRHGKETLPKLDLLK